jgi:hypothetical protein
MQWTGPNATKRQERDQQPGFERAEREKLLHRAALRWKCEKTLVQNTVPQVAGAKGICDIFRSGWGTHPLIIFDGDWF